MVGHRGMIRDYFVAVLLFFLVLDFGGSVAALNGRERLGTSRK
jgi:hypothetical protein